MQYKGLKKAKERFEYDLRTEKDKLLFSVAYKLGYENASQEAIKQVRSGSIDDNPEEWSFVDTMSPKELVDKLKDM